MDINRLIGELHNNIQMQQQLKTSLNEYKEHQKKIEKQIKSILDRDQIEYENLSEEEFQLLLSDMHNPELLNVEVVYADPEEQIIRAVQITPGATIEDCIMISDILDDRVKIDLSLNKVGIYGVIKPIDTPVQDGDRVEIYRPVASKSSDKDATANIS